MKYIFFLLLFPFLVNAQLPDSLISIQSFDKIPSNISIRDIVVTGSNIKYIATNKGLYKIINKTNPAELIIEGDFQALATNRKEDVWAMSANTLLSENEEIITLDEGLVANDIMYHRGNIWIASNKGLYKINLKTKRRTELYTSRNSKLPTDNLSFVFADKQDQIWIGTSQGICLINTKNKWKLYEKNHSMEAMAYNKEGLWLVSDKEMWVIDEFGRWYPAALNKGLKDGIVRDITTDKDGRLVLASNQLVRYNPYIEEIHSYSDDLGFLSKQTNAIEGDANQDIWIGTENDGIYLLSFGDTKTIELTALIEIVNKISCKGNNSGSLEVNAYGGEPPYKYKWNKNNMNEKRISSLSEDTYSVTVTDRNNNTFSAKLFLDNPYPLNLKFDEIKGISKAGQSDGIAKINISGGVKPYTYEWEDGNSDAERTDLKAGFHKLTITDADDCEVVTEIEIPTEKFIPELDLTAIKIGQTLKVDQLFFDADSSAITENFIPVLDEIYGFLKKNRSVVIEIGGHTNGIPPADICYKLSNSRARNIAEYLYNKGIDAKRISYKGYGKDKPIATNETLAGRKQNQRVEIKILSI